MPRAAHITVLTIAGIHDNGGRERLIRALEAVAGVVEAEVNLYRARAQVRHLPGCPAELLVRAAAAAGCLAYIESASPAERSDAPPARASTNVTTSSPRGAAPLSGGTGGNTC